MVGGYMATAERNEVPINKTGFWVMIVGRFVFGLGGECLSVS
jgi:hypothetical protein